MKKINYLIHLLLLAACGGKFTTQSYVSGVTPLELGSLSAWYDTSDTTTLFTDSSCNQKVESNGDKVGCWKDKSGNDNHAKASSTDRGTFNSGDGIDIGGTGLNNTTGACYTISNYPDARTIMAVVDDVSLTQIGRHGLLSQDNSGAGAVHIFFLTDSAFGTYTVSFDGTTTGRRAQVGIDYGDLSTDGGNIGDTEYGNFPVGGPTIFTGRYTEATVADWRYLGCVEDVSGTLAYRGEYKIKELILWDRELTQSEIDAATNYLRIKWRL